MGRASSEKSKEDFGSGGVADELAQAPVLTNTGKREFVEKGGLQYVGEQGGNGAQATFQEAHGAPVEKENPLGYNVGWWTTLFLNISMLIGTGIFSTRE